MYLKIDKINIDVLKKKNNATFSSHYEINLQVFYKKGGVLSNKTVLRYNPNEKDFSFVFLQIPMQAFITHKLCLFIEIVRVVSDPLETGHIGYFKEQVLEDQSQETRILEGWSTINLSDTYLLNNALSGQFIPFHKLAIFDINSKLTKNEKDRLN